MAFLRCAIFATVLLADFCYHANGVPIFEYAETGDGEPKIFLRPKRSDAVAFSGASGSGGPFPHLPFDAGILPKLARGDFSNLHFDIEPHIPPGAQIQSRFGEGEGSDIHVSGRAQGPNGAFSATSAAADSSGKVRYSVKTAKY